MRALVGLSVLTIAAAALLASTHPHVAIGACLVMAVMVAIDGTRYAIWVFTPARLPVAVAAAAHAAAHIFTPAYGAALYDEYASCGLDHANALDATANYFTGLDCDDPLWTHCRGEIATAIWEYRQAPTMPVGDLLLRAA